MQESIVTVNYTIKRLLHLLGKGLSSASVEMAPCIKLLLLNEEDQSSDPKHSYKKLGGHHGHLQSQCSGARIRDPGASLLARFTKSVSSGCKGDPDSACNMREIEDNTRHQPLNPKCASTQVHAYYTYAPNTCRHTSTTYTKEDCFSLLH